MIFDFKNKKRLVIKIGSSLLVSDDGLRQKWLKEFVKDVSSLVGMGFEVVIVSSGAIALGRRYLNFVGKKLSLEEKQAAAAVGQIQLMSFYRDFFKKFDLDVAQILLTASDCNNRSRYLNSKNTINTLIKNHIIPIINENDTIVVEEIKIGDNDRLAARVAQMISADVMILFSDIDGLYTQNPKTHKAAMLIPKVHKITEEIEGMAGGATSSVGTGGMITKIMAAKMLSGSGCDAVITNGIPDGALKKFVEGKQDFTVFLSDENVSKSRKKWLSGFLNVAGEVVVNDCAREALLSKKVSLLPVGVVAISGEFKAGEVVFVKDENGKHIASGISNYDAKGAKKILGKRSEEVKNIFGKSAKVELIHIDNLVVT